jgi:hypothetical protein
MDPIGVQKRIFVCLKPMLTADLSPSLMLSHASSSRLSAPCIGLGDARLKLDAFFVWRLECNLPIG